MATHFGARIRTFRKSLKISQRTLSNRVGISQGQLSRIEKGADTGTDTLAQIARALGKSMRDLFAGESPHRVAIPHKGQASAGTVRFWQEAPDHRDDHAPVNLPYEWINPLFEHFVLQAEGSSMAGVGILDGDLLVIEAGSMPRRGDVVVARSIFGDVLVKKYAHAAPYVILSPGSLLDHDVTILAETDVEILGRVRHVLRLGASCVPEANYDPDPT